MYPVLALSNSVSKALAGLGYKLDDGAPFIPRARDMEVLRVLRLKFEERERCHRVSRSQYCTRKLPETATVGIHLVWEKASLGNLQPHYSDVAR